MVDKKKIMILGAGNAVTPLIERARQRGLDVIVVSPPGDYPGLRLADHVVPVDFKDTDAIVHHAGQLAIDGITCTGTDIVVPTIGRVVDELGLRGTGYAAATTCSDKWLMKQALLIRGVTTARGAICGDPEQLRVQAEAVGFPLMCKATDSSGSQGVFRVDRPEDLHEAWMASKKASFSGRVLLEQYLDGIEFGAQVVVEGTKVKAVFLHDDQLTPPPDHAPVGHSMPCTLNQLQKAASRREIVAAIAALGIRDTIANVDLMLVGDVPYIIEIGARMGATCLPETISIFGGFDAYDACLSLALGEPTGVNEVEPGVSNASRLICSPRDGVVKQIHVPKAVLEHPNVVRVAIYAKPGDTVRRFRVGPDRIGDVVVTGATTAEAESLASAMANLVEIDFA